MPAWGGRVRVNKLILKRLPEVPYYSTLYVIDTDVVQTGDDNVAAGFSDQANASVSLIKFNEPRARPVNAWIP